MITYAEALAMLLREAEPIHETETIPLMYSTGRVLADDEHDRRSGLGQFPDGRLLPEGG